jgi:hypothetical protein
MNERIYTLAEQARQHFPKTESSGEFWVLDEQKFAELIVQECTDLVQKYILELKNETNARNQRQPKFVGQS